MTAIRSNQSLTRAQIEDLVRKWLAEALDDQDLEIAKFKPTHHKHLAEVVQQAEDALEGARVFAFKTRSLGLARYDALPLLAQAGVTDPDEDTIDRFCDLYLRAQVEVYEFALARLSGEVWRGVQDPVFQAPAAAPESIVQPTPIQPPPITNTTPVKTVEQLVREYIDREIKLTTGPKNVVKVTAHLRVFAEIVGGDRPLSSLDRSDLSDLRSVLERLPANVTKFFPGQPLRAVSEANHKKPTLSARSVNEALTRVGAFLSWCRDHGHTDKELPTTRLKLKRSTRAKEARTPFTVGELKLLFSGPLYAGCKSRARRNDPGDYVIRDGTYYLPILGLLTGARLGELLGLTPEDIEGEAGRRVIHIRPNALRGLKNDGSARVVPLHPVLEDLGFGRFLEGRTAMKRSIFEGHAKVRGGSITNNASRWFSSHLDAIGIKRAGLSFHSFRHLFEDVGRASGVPEDLRRALMGHTQVGMGSIYGGADEGFTVEQRRQAIEGLKLPVDLTGLKELAGRSGKRLVVA